MTEYKVHSIATDARLPASERTAMLRIFVGKQEKLTEIPLTRSDLYALIVQATDALRRTEEAAP